MIIDNLNLADLYFCLGERIETGLRYLRDTDFSNVAPGRYEIDGTTIYATIQESMSKPLPEGKWESHLRYLDIHCILKGRERIGYTNTGNLNPGVYDEERDLVFLEEKSVKMEGMFCTLVPGMFSIMMPQDAHMPGICTDEPEQFLKVVVKIAFF